MAPVRCCFDQTAVWHSDAARGPSTPSFDHLVGAGEERRRNFEAKRSCGLQVNDQFELGRAHHGEVGRFFTLKDAAAIDAGLAKLLGNAWSVTHQPAGFGELARRIDCGQYMARRQRSKLHAVVVEQWTRSKNEGFNSLFHDVGKGVVDVAILVEA